ncbi:unnamed protein product [Rotaria sp. Silwood2]|nr:unnamed protein product [Rotaria sp. Silwood2]
MSTSKPVEWVTALIERFEDQLPIKCGELTNQMRLNLEQNKECLIALSRFKFSLVINGLTDILKTIDNTRYGGFDQEKNIYESYLIVLDAVEQCLANTKDLSTSRLHEAIYVNKLLPVVCKLLNVPGDGITVQHVRQLASNVLFALSVNNFSTLFSKVVSRLECLIASGDETYEAGDLDLIQHMNVDMLKLTRLLNEEVQKWRLLKKIHHTELVKSVEKAIWNWLDTYPEEFTDLQKRPNAELSDNCEKLFEFLDSFGEANRRKVQYVWPLQMMLLVLCPIILEELVYALEKGGPCSAEHLRKRNFVDALKRQLHAQVLGKQHSAGGTESAAVVTFVKLCKAATYINNKDSNNVLFVMVQSVIGDLKQILFNPLKPFSRGKQHSAGGTESAAVVTFVKLCKAATYINNKDSNNVLFVMVQSVIGDLKQILFNPLKPFSRGQDKINFDLELMIEFFLACLRLNPHNNEVLKVCLNLSSPAMFHYVLVKALYRIITQKRLAWWPQIDIVYSRAGELRNMFTDTLNKVSQSSTFSTTPLRISGITGVSTLKDILFNPQQLRSQYSQAFKSKTSDRLAYDEGPNNRELLLWIVRLIIVDPYLMLHNPNKLDHETQMSTFELINGLVSLVHDTSMMPDVAHTAMESLLVLHETRHIELWNPEASINTFWSISSQVLFSISQKLVLHQIYEYTSVLRWLREILVLRNAFLFHHKDNAYLGSNIPMAKHAHTKLEIVFFIYLWSIDPEAVKIAMSCFALFAYEADIRFDNAYLGSNIPMAKHAHTKLEIVFFIYLWSIDPEAVKIAMSCFALFAYEADIRFGFDETAVLTLLPNYNIYMELSAASTTLVTTGRNALQKKILSLLRRIEFATPGNKQAWYDTFVSQQHLAKFLAIYPKRVDDLGSGGSTASSPSVNASETSSFVGSGYGKFGKRRTGVHSSEHDIEDVFHEWANMTGFLCALGSVWLPVKNRPGQHGIPADTRRTSMEPVSSDLHYCPVTQFIGDCLKYLVCQNEKFGLQIQRHIQDLLGHELNPLCYPILFDQIKIQVDKFFDATGQVICSEQNTQFIDNVIVIMRSVFEMKAQQAAQNSLEGPTTTTGSSNTLGVPSNNAGSPQSVVGSSSNDPSSSSTSGAGRGGPQQTNENPLANVNSLEQLVLNIVRYARQLDTSVGAVAIRIRVCQLVESMMKRRDDLSFRQEIKFRNKLVEYLTDWIMGNSHQFNQVHALGQSAAGVNVGSGVNVTTSQLVVDQYQHLTRELDQASMEAVATLLHSLPLQPEESDRGDLMEAKSQLFLKYFTLFMNLLNDCGDDLNDDQSSLSDHHQSNTERGTSNMTSQTQQQQQQQQSQLINQLQQKQQSLRNSTIVAMSNLLAANIESGLMRSIALGYHRDPQTRAAFMEVLTQILQQGTEFDTLAETVLADRFERLVELVTMIGDKGELPIAMALANVVSPQYMDELARVFVTIFDAKHLLHQLLLNIFSKEVEMADCYQTILRGNGLPTKIMSFCFKLYGSHYLYNLFAPILAKMFIADLRSYEVDPSQLAKRFAFQFNPALQPRAIIVYGCISKTTSDAEIKALLRILVKALESFSDIDLIDSIIMCLTRLLPLLSPESKIHKFMFWIALSILQLEETQLYASGLALLEQNLHTLDHMLNLFENTSTHQQQTLERIMMDAREPLEWQFKQLDASMGLSFKSNFNFALVGHLIKGFRHPVQSTVVRTTRVLSTLLSIVAKSESHDKFKVTPTSVPYLAALVSVVEEVRSRCPVKHRPVIVSSTTNTNSTNILPLNYSSISTVHPLSHLPQSYSTTSIADFAGLGGNSLSSSYILTNQTTNSTLLNVQQGLYPRRQKSWDASYIEKTRKIGGVLTVSGTRLLSIPSHVRHWHSFDIEHAVPRILTKPASTLVQLQQVKQVVPTIAVTPQTAPETQTSQISSETNHLLDPNVLIDTSTQALLLTVLATLVRNTSDENEMRIIYEYLSESSIVFPKVFPVIHNLLDAKINSVLSLSHDESILASVQSIIYQMIACSAGDDASQQQQQLSYLQSCGFGGLWRFAGPFTVSRQNPDNVELFVNCLEAMVETCLPSLDEHEDGSESGVNSGNGLTGNNGTRHASLHHHRTFRHHPHYYSASSAAACLNANLSSSMSSISIDSIRSPTDREGQFFDLNDLNRPAQSQSQNGNYTRSRITQKPNLI